MTTNSKKDLAPQRSATRAPVGKTIKLQFDDSMDVVNGLCENISIGGMFIKVTDTRSQGSLVRFELQLDESTAVRGLGEVVWNRNTGAAAGRDGGVGIKFRFLEQRDRQLIFKMVSQHIKDRLSKQQPAGGVEAPPVAPAHEPPPPVGKREPLGADFKEPEAAEVAALFDVEEEPPTESAALPSATKAPDVPAAEAPFTEASFATPVSPVSPVGPDASTPSQSSSTPFPGISVAPGWMSALLSLHSSHSRYPSRSASSKRLRWS